VHCALGLSPQQSLGLLDETAQLTQHFGPAEEAGEGNSLGVAPGDGDFDLRRRAAGGSPWRLLNGGGRSAGGDRRGGDGRQSLEALGDSGATPVAPLRRLYFNDKVVGLGLEGGGGARGAAARGGAVVWLGRRWLSSHARRAEG
jgi:hypothetical protein